MTSLEQGSKVSEVSKYIQAPLIFLATEAINPDKEKTDADAAWRFYSHTIIRNPNNLGLHTHRVFFAMNYKEGAFLPGSLFDLFYVLDNAGEALRIRLLKASIPFLSNKELHRFAYWIKSDNKKQYKYRWMAGSVLSEGLFGADQELISKTANVPANTCLSPLEEARSCIEYGQLDMAQTILQDALKNAASNSETQALQLEMDKLQSHLLQHQHLQQHLQQYSQKNKPGENRSHA